MAEQLPNEQGFFGEHGGVFVAEPLQMVVAELVEAYEFHRADPKFIACVDNLLADYVGRPSPTYHAKRLSERYGCRLYLKREDLNHTGAHKINNAIGQVELARRMGKTRIIAETGAGQHGVATATACARAGLECIVYMGEEDIARQRPNVERMNLLGARVAPVSCGSRTLKDALNEAIRDWVANVKDTFYVIGSVAGPHPYPLMVRDFNAVVGRECLDQMDKSAGRQPDVVIACVGGGSNALGIFHPYMEHEDVKLVGVEAGGASLSEGRHAAPLTSGAPVGILHGMRTYVMQDSDGQIQPTSSISAGLDYPAVGPEHAYLRDCGRASYVAASDAQALQAFDDCCRLEGILPALESAHAIAHVPVAAKELGTDAVVLVNLSGRGDKDLATALAHLRPEGSNGGMGK